MLCCPILLSHVAGVAPLLLHYDCYGLAVQAVGTELSSYIFLYMMYTYVNANSTTFVFILPLLALRLGQMFGNWG